MSTGSERSIVRHAVPVCVALLVAGATLVLTLEARRTPRAIHATGGPPPVYALHDPGAAALDAQPDGYPVWFASEPRLDRGP